MKAKDCEAESESLESRWFHSFLSVFLTPHLFMFERPASMGERVRRAASVGLGIRAHHHGSSSWVQRLAQHTTQSPQPNSGSPGRKSSAKKVRHKETQTQTEGERDRESKSQFAREWSGVEWSGVEWSGVSVRE